MITRDPLDWLADRGCAWATANANGDTLELPVYITRDEVQRQMHAGGTDLETTLGTVGESVLVTAAQCQGSIFAGAYPDLAFHGEVPRLLDQPPGVGGLGAPGLAVRSAGWEPVGLGAIQDLVQEAFGPVDLDRSAVALQPVATPNPDCPACGDDRFGFPGELGESAAQMCDAHRSEASIVTASRMDRAQASNRAGWRALGKASATVRHSCWTGSDPPPDGHC